MTAIFIALALTASQPVKPSHPDPDAANQKFAAVHHTVKKPVHKPAKPHSK